MNSIISADQCKSARSTLGLSQAAVARATGINRTQLALFEVRRYVLEDERLRTLRAYFEAGGYQFARDAEAASAATAPATSSDRSANGHPDAKLLDGFIVASGLDEAPVEDMLAEIANNDEAIVQLAALPGRTGFWGGEPIAADRDTSLRLMARNYLLVRGLQGRDVFPRAEPSSDAPPSVATQLRQVLNAVQAPG